ncbi:MAG: chemotaxis protein CheA [Clostridiales bacterium]
MSNQLNKEPMLDTYVFESNQLLEQLEQLLIACEKTNSLDEAIDEIFRIMHTIKGSSSMMLFNNISEIAHSIEDLFYILRDNKDIKVNTTEVINLVLEALDFIKLEISKVEQLVEPDGSNKKLSEKIRGLIKDLKPKKATEKDNSKDSKYYVVSQLKDDKIVGKNYFEVCIKFMPDSLMENIRSFQMLHSIKEKVNIISYDPNDLFNNSDSCEIIQDKGFRIKINSNLNESDIEKLLEKEAFVENITIEKIEESNKNATIDLGMDTSEVNNKDLITNPSPINASSIKTNKVPKQNFISVSVKRLDILMDLVGEMVITEAMVINNPDLENLELENFSKASRQLKKITNELQDIVMSIRMVPLSMTLQKMNRIVRDMSFKLNKQVKLEIIGEETEVDKNIIEQISDPLMHLIRNAIDHGIETVEKRTELEKSENATITLEALNSGGDVYIIVKDDGIGLNKDKILERAKKNNLVKKPVNELTDKEIYSFILLPGFSTKENVTEFSGRGVGMDVVKKNIEKIGGTISIDSKELQGTSITIKIPLTLAIIDGMGIKVVNSIYTVPTVSIKESFKIKKTDLITDPNNNEMIVLRGNCFKIIRLHKLFGISTNIQDIQDGILMIIEDNGRSMCIFSDELIGEQQVVVKPLPNYIKKSNGISGCTILGVGNISLILDIPNICDISSYN